MAASYPGAIKNFSAVVNGVTKLVAALFNAPYDEITAIQTELGTDVAGSVADLKTRLAVLINDDGTFKDLGWINFNGVTMATNDSFNVASIAEQGAAGNWTVNWDTDFASNDYACVASANNVMVACPKPTEELAAGTAGIQTRDAAGTETDSSSISVIAMGNQ